jgi:methionyl-tRNA formyltransferase
MAQPQPRDGASLTRSFHRNDGRLDPNEPAGVLERKVRAFQPWPGTFIEVDGLRIVVLRARTSSAADYEAPGRLVRDDEGLALTTVAGRLVLAEVKPAGGRAMTADAFLRGHPSILGRSIRSSSDAA